MCLLNRIHAAVALAIMTVALIALLGTARANEVTLRAVSAWPEKNF